MSAPETAASPRRVQEAASVIDHVPADTHEAVASLAQTRRRLMDQIGRVIVGQHRVLDQVLTAFFAKGHCVLQGVPGLAKLDEFFAPISVWQPRNIVKKFINDQGGKM